MTSRDKITWFFILVVLWMSGALFITLHEYFFLANYPGVTKVEEMTSYSFSGSLIAAVVWGVMAGSIFSALELFYFSWKGQRKKFITILLRVDRKNGVEGQVECDKHLPACLTLRYDFEKNSSQEMDRPSMAEYFAASRIFMTMRLFSRLEGSNCGSL